MSNVYEMLTVIHFDETEIFHLTMQFPSAIKQYIKSLLALLFQTLINDISCGKQLFLTRQLS